MHANLFDRYQTGNSWLHRADGRVKVLLTLGTILSNALLPDGSWLAFGFTWLLLLAVCLSARLSLRDLLRRSMLALPFALAAVTMLFSLPGRTLLTLDMGPFLLSVTDAGTVRFVSILLRAWLSVQAALLLVASVQFPDLMHALRHLHVPQILVAIVSFMYRYLFVLSDEALRMLHAREARSARLPGIKGGGRLKWRAGTAGSMVGQLFLRTYERSERVYQAMLARGYSGELLTLHAHTLTRRDLWLLTFGIFILLILQIVARG